MRRLASSFAILLIAVGVASADVTVKGFRRDMADPNGQMTGLTQAYIQGLGDGFAFTNAQAISAGKEPLFCQPEKLVLQIENYLDIINQQIKEWDSSVRLTSIRKTEDMSIGYLLLRGLQATFPCKK